MKLPQVNCEYGAPMGRASYRPENPDEPIRMHLVRVRLDSGGYDSGGAYWGIGGPLYWAHGEDEEMFVQLFTRAASREEAKARVRAEIPAATFYR